MKRIVHVITNLEGGGAQMMLVKLLRCLDRDAFACSVISMTDAGAAAPIIEALGIPVHALGMRPSVPDPRGLARLVRLLRRERPDLVHAWMVHANLLAGVAARLAGGLPVVWEVQQGPFEEVQAVRHIWWLSWIGGRIEPWLAARTIFCAETARDSHARLGYARERLTTIPNGIDVSEFRPDAAARQAVRAELSVPAGAPLIGLFARFDPQKDHRTFIEAARLLAPDVHFVLCGDGITRENAALGEWIARAGIAERTRLLGRRGDMPRLTAALDLLVSSSITEGCPNVIGEAMACGVPVVATDAGTSAVMIGDTGCVVPRRQPAALARACGEILALDAEARRALGRRARARVVERYSLDDVTRRYAALYGEIVDSRRTAPVTS